MNKKKTVKWLWGIGLSLLIIMTCFLINSNRLRVGMNKSEAEKILGPRCKNLNEGGIKFIYGSPLKKRVEVFLCRRQERPEGISKRTLILCFEDEKLSSRKYGRGGLDEIMKRYPSLYQLLKAGRFGGFPSER